MKTISDRLIEELVRINKAPKDMGPLGEAVEKVNQKFGGLQHHPDAAALATISKTGVDVIYVFTGMRAQPIPNSPKSAAKKKTHPGTWIVLILILIGAFLWWGNANYDPERARRRAVIEECEKHLADPLITLGEKRTIILPVCDRLKREYNTFYGTNRY